MKENGTKIKGNKITEKYKYDVVRTNSQCSAHEKSTENKNEECNTKITSCKEKCEAKKQNLINGGKKNGISECEMDMDKTNSIPDGGYGWIVMMCAFILQGTACGTSFSVGVFFTKWLEVFQEDHDVTAWVGSLNTGLMLAFGPFASVLVKHLGHRAVCILGGLLSTFGLFLAAYATEIWHLYLSYGLIAGIGVCLMYVPAAVVCSTYFDKLRPLALGIASSGVGFFCVVIPHFLSRVIEHYGWRSGMICMSALCIQSCLFSSLLIPVEFWNRNSHRKTLKHHIQIQLISTSEKSQLAIFEDSIVERNSNMRKITVFLSALFDIDLLCDVRFILYFVNNICWNIGSLILLVMIKDYALSVGMLSSQGNWLLSIVGLSGLVGRTTVGAICNLPNINRFWVHNTATLMTAFAIGFLPFYAKFIYFAIFCGLYGLFFGAQVGSLAITTTELFGLGKLPMAFGYVMVANGMGAFLGPPIGGVLYELTKAYNVPFYFGGAISFVGFLLTALIPIIYRKNKHLAYTETEVQISVS